MVIQFNLKNVFVRILVCIGLLAALGFASFFAYRQFLISNLLETSTDISFLVAATVEFPDSGRLFSKLAALELTQTPPDLATAEQHAARAIELSPDDYRFPMLLAEIRTAGGDRAGTASALADALRLAPNYYTVHWQLANLFLSIGRTDDAVEHYRIAVGADPGLLPPALDKLWGVNGQNITRASQIVNGNPAAQMKLAIFLLGKARITEAVDIFGKIENVSALPTADISAFLDGLIQKGYFKIANDLWRARKIPPGNKLAENVVWNGDFETGLSNDLRQFDWQIEKNDFAKISIEGSKGHSGTHSLLLEFTGHDTTRLDNELRQLIVLRPGIAYQLSFWVKAERFRAPNDGPVVAVSYSSGDNSNTLVAKSKPISVENMEWQQMFVDFTTPRNAVNGAPVTVSIKRQPKYAYDEPTTGRLRFDDFSISEAKTR